MHILHLLFKSKFKVIKPINIRAVAIRLNEPIEEAAYLLCISYMVPII